MKRLLMWVTLFALPWLAVLCHAELRGLLGGQVLGSSLAPQLPWPWHPPEDDPFDPSHLAQAFPDDVNALASAAEANVLTGSSKALPGSIGDYDRLIQRFPRKTWLIQGRLRQTLGYFRDDRLGGDYENRSRPPYAAPSPEKSKEPPNFSPAELSRAISVARQGRVAEPDNAFFDLALATLLFAGYHDDEGYRVLSEGSRKPRFDDGSLDSFRALIRACERVRPLLWEEQVTSLFGNAFSYQTKIREFARLLSWQAWKMERAGNHARALTIRSDFARLTALMTRGRNWTINGLVGIAMQSMMWGIGSPQRGRMNSGQRRDEFVAYAAQHGRPDLAREVRLLEKQAAQMRQLAAASVNQGSLAGLPRADLVRVRTAWWLMQSLLALMAVALLGCGFLSLWLVRSKPAPFSSRQRWADAIAIGAVGASLSLAVWIVNADEVDMMLFRMSSTLPPWHGLVFGTSVVSLVLSPLAWGALWCGLTTWWQLQPERMRRRDAQEPRYEGESAHLMTSDWRPLLWTLAGIEALGFAVIGGVVALALAVFAPDFRPSAFGPSGLDIEPAVALAGVAAFFGGVSLIVWLIRWRFFAPPDERAMQHLALRRYRDLMGTSLLLASYAWLTIGLLLLPERREAALGVQRLLDKGEIALLKSPPPGQ